MEITIGCVAECQQGKLGIVHTILVPRGPYPVLYKGIGFDGKNWESKEAKFIANNVHEYIIATNAKHLGRLYKEKAEQDKIHQDRSMFSITDIM